MHPTFRSATTRVLLVALAAAAARNATAQNPSPTLLDLPSATLALSDLTEFRTVRGDWKIVGSAATDRLSSPVLVSSPGTGILVSAAPGASLSTKWEHGDLDLSFDVLLPEGSAPTVLLMGRYGVPLSESRMSGAPTMATIGAVAPRWDEARGASHEAFEGTLPRQDAGRAPGLWQHVDIVFRAPKFAAGRKLANARFVKVSVNSVVVQDNVQVTGPTRGAAYRDESSSGPLVIDATHGVLALRNVRYKSYTGAVELAGLGYRVYEGDAMDASYATTHAPARQGTTRSIPGDFLVPQDKFAVAYEGTMTAPTTGNYRFSLSLGWIGNDSATRGAAMGGGSLSIDGKTVIMHNGAERRSQGDVQLAAGSHAFAVSYYKNRASFNRRDISITVEGPGIERQSLTDDSPAFGAGGFGAPINPIMVEAEAEPVVLRSFMRHRNTKRVLAASVADPRGVHYTYDLAQGSLLYVWRGPFLETTQMWHERGEDQTAEPLGSALTLPGTPSVAYLADANAAWPDSVDERQFRRDGYRLDKGGHPTFLSTVRGNAVEDALLPSANGLALRRELRIHAAGNSTSAGGPSQGLFVQVAQADHILRQRDGSYVVGDRSFYITLPDADPHAILRRVNGMDELLLPVRFTRGEASIAYSIVW
jgi:hypothetical protein